MSISTIVVIQSFRWQLSKVFYWLLHRRTINAFTLPTSTIAINRLNARLMVLGNDSTIHTLQTLDCLFFFFNMKKHVFCSVKVPENGIPPDWYNYFLCGVKGIYDELTDAPQIGMFVTVSGNIPPASGLSSSSALVSAATLATSFINKVRLYCCNQCGIR